MCKGAEEEKHGGFCRSHLRPAEDDDATSHGETRGSIPCELCGLRASLYCLADKAYLCRKCDKWVHKANFLAFRHVRCFLCNTCQNLSRRYLIGASVEVTVPTNIGRLEGRDRNCSS
ncbi:hypothetical protein QN277_008380 [Acacia crassicarpa]|uniref:B box-type domain-containing protein n=1 Tax=Acacia crassicarpa TaxID=499986 RepID=A0AAE1IQE4_9FABA|nr:hypothetical protein QN277_008380 [Acacia crassicarpa]